MKKRVRVYKPKQQMKNGGSANNTQDSILDPIAEERTNNFASWLKESAIMGAEREQKKEFEKYMKSMAQEFPGYGSQQPQIPMAQNGFIPSFSPGNTLLSPGSSIEKTTKDNNNIELFTDQVNANQSTNKQFFGDLGTLGGIASMAFATPDVFKGEGTLEGAENVDMTDFEITGYEKGKNKRHRTLKYNATGTQKAPQTNTFDPNTFDPNATDISDEEYEEGMSNWNENLYGEEKHPKLNNDWNKIQQGFGSENNSEDRKHPGISDAYFKMKQGLGNTSDNIKGAFGNAYNKIRQGRPESARLNLRDGGSYYDLPKAQNGTECPIGYKKDLQGNCVNQISGEQYQEEISLDNPGLDNPWGAKPNSLTGETPMSFDASGENYLNNGITGASAENPVLGSGLNTQTQLNNPGLDNPWSKEGQLDLRKQSKLKTINDENPGILADGTLGAFGVVGWAGERDEVAEAEADAARKFSDPFETNLVAGSNRGDRMANVPGFGNELKPDQHTRWGRDTKVAQDGMEVGDEQLSFREAFAKNKAAGAKEFTWNGKSYSTQTAEENALTLNNEQLDDYISNAYSDTKAAGWSKSTGEILNSYVDEYWDRKYKANPDYWNNLSTKQNGGGMNIGQETEMSDEEIQRLLAQGYKLEYLD